MSQFSALLISSRYLNLRHNIGIQFFFLPKTLHGNLLFAPSEHQGPDLTEESHDQKKNPRAMHSAFHCKDLI